MILHLIWQPSREGDRPRDVRLNVREAYPTQGWLCYVENDGVRHWIPGTSLLEVYAEAERDDPDPMTLHAG